MKLQALNCKHKEPYFHFHISTQRYNNLQNQYNLSNKIKDFLTKNSKINYVHNFKLKRTYTKKGNMKMVTLTELRKNIYNLLDEVLNTGIPIEIIKGGIKLQIITKEKIVTIQHSQS